MRTDVAAPSTVQASRAAVTATLFRAGGPAELLAGTAGDALDLTPFVASGAEHTESEATLPLRYGRELLGGARPKPGQVVQIKHGADVLFNGIVDTISRERESKGERSMTLTIRRRDAMPRWREVHCVSSVYGAGADLGALARDVARNNLGLGDAECEIPGVGVTVPHDTVQLADLTAWAMLTTILQPALREPYVDARGVLKAIRRDVRREPDVTLSWAQVVALETSGAKSPVTSVKVRWLDPVLREVQQMEQPLATAQLVCGLFTPYNSVEVHWSADRRQRARNTTMRVLSSIGIVGEEWYRAAGDYGGRVYCELSPAWAGLFGASLGAYYAANKIPEPVQVGVTGTGTTVPWYKAAAKNAAMASIWVAVAKQGFGSYEIWGQPYDYVHAINETEAYDSSAPLHAQKMDVLENYLVPDESGAQALAVNELIYQARAAASGTVTMVDDRRLERGDVLALPDGRRFYVTGYRRQLARGSPATLDLGGFYL